MVDHAPITNPADSSVLDEVEATIERFARVRSEIGRVIFGQERVVEESLTTLLAGGHVLLVGVPGLAKTRLVETLGVVVFSLEQAGDSVSAAAVAVLTVLATLGTMLAATAALRRLPHPVLPWQG